MTDLSVCGEVASICDGPARHFLPQRIFALTQLRQRLAAGER
jgi:hypothetical protein